MELRHYQLFGMVFASAFEIPWAIEIPAEDRPDVMIRRADEAGWQARTEAASSFEFEVPQVAAYRISQGREIIVRPFAGVTDEAARLYLLGSALGVLLHQRDLLVLHANAISLNGGAILFMGRSGAGKSTLAGWFSSRGHRVLTDDICAVSVSVDQEIVVLPGLSRLRLAEDAAENLAFDVRDGTPCASSGKREIALPHAPLVAPLPLRACYLLSDAAADGGALVRPRAELDAVDMLMANTYRGVALQQLGASAAHLAACMRVAATAPCFEVRRPKDWAQFNAVGEALLAHASRPAHD